MLHPNSYDGGDLASYSFPVMVPPTRRLRRTKSKHKSEPAATQPIDFFPSSVETLSACCGLEQYAKALVTIGDFWDMSAAHRASQRTELRFVSETEERPLGTLRSAKGGDDAQSE